MDYKSEVRNLLLQLEVNRSYTGYEYVVYGVSLVIRDRNCTNYITKSLYLDIAKEYNTSWQRVERNIRTVVKAVWRTKNVSLLKMVCGGQIIKRPKNKEFFLLLSDFVISIYSFEVAATRAHHKDASLLIAEGSAIGKYLKDKGYSKDDVGLIASIVVRYFN